MGQNGILYNMHNVPKRSKREKNTLCPLRRPCIFTIFHIVFHRNGLFGTYRN